MITALQLRQFSPRCDYLVMAPALAAAAAEFGIDSGRRIAHWLAQLHHESRGFTQLEENLRYSAARLCEVWPKRLPDLAAAAAVANNPGALAERVYGGRLGNTQPGDGWLFRGGGLIMTTGRDNYAAAGAALGLDLLAEPQLLRQPKAAARAGGAYWRDHNLNPLADAGDVAGITRAIQGGSLGLAERQALTLRALTIWR